jgi:hypothetical protein
MFPFDQPAPTAFYLVLYLATFVLHVLPMAYVLAGSAVVVVRTVLGSRPDDDPLVAHLREWLPFILSAAITAGIAPLLFLQILYRREFYTANLLLFNRWMAILPVLIVGFYSLYLVKGNWLWRQVLPLRLLVVSLILACFAFIAWSWTENHVLSVATQAVWTEQYVSLRIAYLPTEIWPRMGVWAGGVFPVMAALAAWPLAAREHAEHPAAGRTARWLAIMALLGLVVSLASIAGYGATIEPAARDAVLGSRFRVWLALLVIGVVLQIAGWMMVLRAGSLPSLARWLATTGAVLAVVGLVVCREGVRTSRVDLAALVDHHGSAASVGGFWLFAAFLVINFSVIAGCVWLVLRSLPKESTDDRAH